MRAMLMVVLFAGGAALAQESKQIEAGKRVYQDQKCSTCHQIAGHGNRMFPLDGVGTRLAEADLRRWFTHTADMENALPKRPAIRMSSRKYDFRDADLAALVAYLKTLK